MKPIKQYLNLFKVKKVFWQTLAIDLFTIFVITMIFLSFGKMLTAKAVQVSNGKTTEELKVDLLSNGAEYSEAFLKSIKSFTLYLVVGGMAVLFLVLLVYSLSRKAVWEKLSGQKFKFKLFSRWNLLNLFLFVVLILYLLLYGLVSIIINLFLGLGKFSFSGQVMNVIGIFFFIAFLMFVFLTYYFFVQNNKIISSINSAFHLLKTKIKAMSKAYLLFLVTFLLLSLALSVANKHLYAYPDFLFCLNIILFVCFLNWMRMDLVQKYHDLTA